MCIVISKEEIGKKLRQAREEKKLTQAQVAEKVGLSTNFYACIERGEETTSFENMGKIFETLGIKLILS